MAISTTPVDGNFTHEAVGRVDYDAIDTEKFIDDKVGRTSEPDEGLANDGADVAKSEQDLSQDEPAEGEDDLQVDPDAETDEAAAGDEPPAEDSGEPGALLADEFGTVPELEQSYVSLKEYVGRQDQALSVVREEARRLQLQAARVPVPAQPVRFESILDPTKRQQLAELAAQQGFENPQQLLYHAWTQDVAQANQQNAAIDREMGERQAQFDHACNELQAYVSQPKHQSYAQRLTDEWKAQPELFEALQMLPPAQMLKAAKHFTDLVVRAAAADQRQQTFDKEALRARQNGREEHRQTRDAKRGGSTEASRPNSVSVGKSQPKPAEDRSSRVRSKLAELEDYERHDRHT